MNIKAILLAVITALTLNTPVVLASADEHGHEKEAAHEEDKHDDHDEAEGEHEEEAGVVKLTSEQMQTAGIEVSPLLPKTIAAILDASGEVKLNDYKTIKVTPRIAAQVVARHARLGDIVKKGQSLLTLSSVEMAEAQGGLLVADREWKRVEKLGRKVVSARRYTEARVKSEQARSRVLAYGMTRSELSALLDRKSGMAADGEFQLLASQAGRVLHDKFIIGERVEPGRVLMVIADESVMWVEARITPDQVEKIRVGNKAQVMVGKRSLPAYVSQIHHTLDEVTRTLAVRLSVNNPDDILHPGMFVTARIASSDSEQGLVLPESAVMRSPDGDWQVLVEQDEAGEFKAVEIELQRVIDGQAVISGIKAGTRVVFQGAFFVQSELAKSGFEIHNH